MGIQIEFEGRPTDLLDLAVMVNEQEAVTILLPRFHQLFGWRDMLGADLRSFCDYFDVEATPNYLRDEIIISKRGLSRNHTTVAANRARIIPQH
jgi:hypothetical protein